MRILTMLLSASLLLPSVVFAQDRLYVYQEGNIRSKMSLLAPCPEEGRPMEKRKAARSAAIEQGFSDGSCLRELNDINLSEMATIFSVGIPTVYYLKPEEIEAFRVYSDNRGEEFVTSESMPPEE